MCLQLDSAVPIVFLGPSLAAEKARLILDADYRPPVQRGDLDALADCAVVGIIDGILDRTMRVPPLEVRRAMDRGIRFFGAASTGALLAASLNDPRMVGVGRIYEFLRAYPDAGEDLISIVCVEYNWTAMTVPLIDAVLSVVDLSNRAGRRDLDIDALILSLRSLPLTGRSPEAIRACVQDTHCLPYELSSRFRVRNYKRCDARRLLSHLESIIRSRDEASS